MNQIYTFLNILGKSMHNIWQYDLLTMSGHQIRVSNVIFALLACVIGFKHSEKFTKIVKNQIKARVNNDRNAANIIEKIILYLGFCVYIITILEIANIPINSFAFIGGALALGIGLGSQTLITNFIGSIIIIIERSLKIGDIIEIDGITGIVTSVGGRCVMIKTFTDTEVIIPNSNFTQNILTNWTLSDNLIKCQVEISVQKTEWFDNKKFIQLLKAAVDRLELNNQYIPEIYLTKIDSDLTFSVTFYLSVTQIQERNNIKDLFNTSLFELLKDYEFKVLYPKLLN